MLHAITAEQARRVEQRAVAESNVILADLMARAGHAVMAEIEERLPEGRIVVLAGPGNNGGDGWVAARLLVERGRDVEVLSMREPDMLAAEAADAARQAVDAGVRWRALAGGPTAQDVADAAVVVDALLGTGAGLPLRPPLPEWCHAANASGAAIVSVDVPTGTDCDSGDVSPDAIEADLTVTFTDPKRGLVTFPAAAFAGEIVVADIGVDRSIAEDVDAPEVWTHERLAALVPLPAPDAHKNARGRLLIVAGSQRFAGAAVLAARGAMRAGAGYVTLAVPRPVVPAAQAHLLAVPVVGLPAARSRTFSAEAADAVFELASDFDAVVVGPGLTLADGAVATARRLIERLDKPLVIDADALNALVDAPEILDRRRGPAVLTPHPGELARLLGVSAREVQADRVSSSAKLASEGRVVALKGAGTVVSEAGRQLIVTAGTPALATAGAGDVLSGVIGALLAQGMAPFEAAGLGAHAHGLAGEHAARALTVMCVTAEDVPEYLPIAFADLLAAD